MPDSPTMPASRLAAQLSKSASVKRVREQFEHRVHVQTTDGGLGRTDLKTIREYGWEISGIGMEHNSVSIVRGDQFWRGDRCA